jgi:hypothetical protein
VYLYVYRKKRNDTKKTPKKLAAISSSTRRELNRMAHGTNARAHCFNNREKCPENKELVKFRKKKKKVNDRLEKKK